jgi:hypothetical protein
MLDIQLLLPLYIRVLRVFEALRRSQSPNTMILLLPADVTRFVYCGITSSAARNKVQLPLFSLSNGACSGGKSPLLVLPL